MSTLIDRFLFREVFKALAVILLVILLLLLARALVLLLGEMAEGAFSSEVLPTLVGLKMLKISGKIIPPAFFFSILWVLGRMYRDSEMLALEAAGVGTFRIYRAFALSTLPLALLVTWLVMTVLPWSKNLEESIENEQKHNVQIVGLQPGNFAEFGEGGLVVYTGDIGKGGEYLSNVFVQHRKHGDLGLVLSDRAYRYEDSDTGDQYVVLTDGNRYVGEPGGTEYSLGEFKEYAFRLPKKSDTGVRRGLGGASWQELLATDTLQHRAEFQYRISFPLSVFAFAVVSIPLARSLPRQGVYGRVGLAVLIYFIFTNLQELAHKWMGKGETPLYLGMWWVPFLMILVALLVILVDSMRFKYWWKEFKRERF